MSIRKRRIVLGLGAMLLVGGWGARPLEKINHRELTSWGSDLVLNAGIVSMVIGAGLIAFGIPRPKEKE